MMGGEQKSNFIILKQFPSDNKYQVQDGVTDMKWNRSFPQLNKAQNSQLFICVEPSEQCYVTTLPMMMQMFYKCTPKCGSNQLYVVREHFKCGLCDRTTEFLIFFNLDVSSHM